MVIELKLFVCDYCNPSAEQMEHFIFEAVDEKDAEAKAIEELKTLGIPKRYILNIEEAI